MRNILAFALTVLSCHLSAQQAELIVRGKVVDATSGEPVIGASVYLPARKDGTTTNVVGEYFLHLEVSQLALSAEAFEYMDAIKKPTESTGSIFDPPPTFIRGNLFNAGDEEDIVLGYFYAGGASRKDLAIDRSVTGQIPRPFAQLAGAPVYCGEPCDPLCLAFTGEKCGYRPCPPDCASIPGVTNIAPDAWPFVHHPCE